MIEASRRQRIAWMAALAAACVVAALAAVRLAVNVGFDWWTLPALVVGMAAADLASGLVHWSADTWGHDDLPVVGRRLLVPFRLHHLDPDDLTRRRFADCNGDVAAIALPVLAGLLVVPLDRIWPAPAVAIFGFAGVGMWTNQIHKWAHLPAPPRLVRLLQNAHVILGRREHERHHHDRYDSHYCITTGWWNRPLEAVQFFRRAEALVTFVTAAEPRQDEHRYLRGARS
ncbi:MAG TPA: fatty acid desaturase CarF family protein [Vicinamibacterales bacterium]|nr:fatty acid desaturase CarF family protein [Vicinamibacterales bacterium]